MMEMKDSEVEWIGAIPASWRRTSLLNNLRKKISDGPHETPNVVDNGIPFISVDSLNDSEFIDFNCVKKYISESDYLEYSKKAAIEYGDILFSKAATIGKTAIVGKEKFMVWSPLAIIKTDPIKCYNKYIYYVLNCPGFIRCVSFMGSMNTQINVGMRELEKGPIPVPSLTEQQHIAAFLDRKCADIDNVLEKTKASIEEYKKLKQSVITEAVTKGIRKKRTMKDSEIEWIGEIPEEWESIKLKYCSYIRARLGWKGLKADEYVEEGYPLLSAFNIINSKLDFTDVNFINQFRYDESPEIKLSINDILLVKDGAGIGKCAIVDNLPYASTTNGSLAVITVRSNLKPKYLYYYFLSSMFQHLIDRLKDGMGVPHLFQADMREIQIVYGSQTEQQEIIDYLDKKCSVIDSTIESKEKFIGELESYKKSLIYEYVTGKKEVK